MLNVPPSSLEFLETIRVAGREFAVTAPPVGFVQNDSVGILLPKTMTARRIWLDDFICHPRVAKLPSGDYLLLFAAGPMHYGWAKKERKGNTMLAMRSTDSGRTWSEAQPAWDVSYSQHAVALFQPPDEPGALYAFGTEPRLDLYDGEENAAIGFRRSTDEGRTWSMVEIICPRNDPEFRGMSAMRMCAAASGAWLVGSHTGEWSGEEGVDRRVQTRQYVLRTEDRGATWDLLPGARPDGWFAPGFDRMDEGRPIHLGNDEVLLMARTPAGALWTFRSFDAGRTWSTPEPTPLAHPDAPPMLFHFDDAGTLIAFHHNRNVKGMFSHENRTELWFSLSTDGGRSWDEPRFVLANTTRAVPLKGWGGSTPMVSYADLLVDGDDLHLFVDHQMRQVIHVNCTRQALLSCPTRDQLFS